MKAKEMLKTIKYVEEKCHGITQMSKSRVRYFQRKNLPMMEGVEYDSSFDDFIQELKDVMGSGIAQITAKKILNNWYIWAEDNLNNLQSIPKFEHSSDPIDFLIKNDFKVEHARFAKLAKDYPNLIETVQIQMPKNSLLFQKLKNVADNTFPSPRGFSYEYLTKVVAGFSSLWC
ncbi:hypothetical protein [Bacillus cereus group sp. BfR-BA-00999]|uniref:hypothetical protein n=1 Tax=Bacillus cereus group sp. BfR-BA-00999 TaxID=3094871 RepID=UPI0029C3BA2F|nr:hypothetical protein [Bacillus cereus group sp. BfR-BA-00999]MDX5886404.1 hypothetical protein [Bacillus cereus group sp. BfR-BA-00999]